jgi:argininosuccinate lyase
MSKLWQKKISKIDKNVESFTVGNDYILDLDLLGYDCIASIAHVKMLEKIRILTKDETKKLIKALREIYRKSNNNSFKIKLQDEDCHTAIENYLTLKLKDIGKKVHTGRSRNDQVITAVRLFEKDNLINIGKKVLLSAENCLNFARKNEFSPLPGYTHFQRAMPSSVGILFSAYTESFIDDFIFLDSVYTLINNNPLGSAAGYGVNLPLDRNYTSKLLGFAGVQNNVLYVQNSRGKFEILILQALSNLLLTINKICSDILLFTTKEFSFFSLPDEYTTGSSIMAQKKNPDVFEILLAKSNVLNGYCSEINFIIRNLPSGYHRDFQLIKEPLIKGFKLVTESLDVFNKVIGKIKVNEKNCLEAMSEDIYSADRANLMVISGIPFRDAYNRSTSQSIGSKIDPVKNLKSKKHLGAPGNLGLNKTYSKIKKLQKYNHNLKNNFKKMVNSLVQ